MSDFWRTGSVRLYGIAVCLFCVGCASERQPMPLDTFSPTETYEAGDSAVVVELIVEEVADKDHPQEKKRTKKYRILQVLKDDSGDLKVGQELKRPLRIAKVAKQSILVHSPDDDPQFVWTAVANFTPAMAEYLKGFPPGEGDRENAVLEGVSSKQCSHLLKYLEHNEQSIAKDAYDRLSMAEPKILASLANEFPRKKLLTWVADPKFHQGRQPTYWLMLGQCGRREDVPVFEKKLESIKSKKFWNALGTAEVIAGYVLLTREAGIKRLEETHLRSDSPVEATEATLRGLGLARMYAVRASISEDSFNNAVIPVMDHPRLAASAIKLLAEWKVWSVRERLAAKYKESEKKKDQEMVSNAIIAYMQLMSRQLELTEEQRQEPHTVKNQRLQHVKFAEKFLEEVEKQHPGKGVEPADQFF